MNKSMEISNSPYVNKVMRGLCIVLFNDKITPNKQIGSVDIMIGVLGKFENFSENRQSLSRMKEILYTAYQKENVKRVMDISAALSTMINSYQKQDAHYKEFEQAIPTMIEQLKTRQKQLQEKLENQHVQTGNTASDFLSNDDPASKESASSPNPDGGHFSEPFSPVQ